MTGEVLGPRWEVTTDVLLNKRGVKLSSTYLCLYREVSITLSLGQKSLSALTLNAETHKGQSDQIQ